MTAILRGPAHAKTHPGWSVALAAARRLLKAGGLLYGHDHADCWPGVKEAVGGLVPGRFPYRSIWWAFES